MLKEQPVEESVTATSVVSKGAVEAALTVVTCVPVMPIIAEAVAMVVNLFKVVPLSRKKYLKIMLKTINHTQHTPIWRIKQMDSYLRLKYSHNLKGVTIVDLKRLRDLREDLDLKQSDIASFLNVTQQAYSRYEQGIREIPLKSLIQLSDFYNVSVDYLVGETKTKYRIGKIVDETTNPVIKNFIHEVEKEGKRNS